MHWGNRMSACSGQSDSHYVYTPTTVLTGEGFHVFSQVLVGTPRLVSYRPKRNHASRILHPQKEEILCTLVTMQKASMEELSLPTHRPETGRHPGGVHIKRWCPPKQLCANCSKRLTFFPAYFPKTKLSSSLPLSKVTQRRRFSACVKEMSRPGPVLYCSYPDPSTPIELITPSPAGEQ